MANDRISQEVVEVVTSPDSQKARISQEVIEAITSFGGAARTSQEVIEILREYRPGEQFQVVMIGL